MPGTAIRCSMLLLLRPWTTRPISWQRFRIPHLRLLSSVSCSSIKPADFRPKRALILSKVSRYEYERQRHPAMSEQEFESCLTNRGSDYTMIKYHHNVHKTTEEQLMRALETRGIELRRVQRLDYVSELLNWADVVFTAGGDGTFLLGASKILTQDKPIIGINTDPTRSEGYLCLPKHFSFDIDHAVDQILRGSFTWFFRRRIRITVIGDKDAVLAPPIELNNQKLPLPEFRYMDFLAEQNVTVGDHPLIDHSQAAVQPWRFHSRRLPVLALNEVFVGESLSSRVSYLEVQFDDDNFIKTRNSGLCVSTGTGSTSWTYNINKLTRHSVESLLKILSQVTDHSFNFKDMGLLDTITRHFNNQLVFDPQLNLMAYTLRDPVSIGTVPTQEERKPRGKARRIEVKSRCFDACLVIDGSLSYKFNDGTRAILEIFDDDALRTVQLCSCKS